MAICYPFKHQVFKISTAKLFMFSLYVANLIVNWGYIQTHLKDGTCRGGKLPYIYAYWSFV